MENWRAKEPGTSIWRPRWPLHPRAEDPLGPRSIEPLPEHTVANETAGDSAPRPARRRAALHV